MFLFTDAHVANESFLELINNMLTSGMIPALYDDGEKEGLISNIREEVMLLSLAAMMLSIPAVLKDFGSDSELFPASTCSHMKQACALLQQLYDCCLSMTLTTMLCRL